MVTSSCLRYPTKTLELAGLSHSHLIRLGNFWLAWDQKKVLYYLCLFVCYCFVFFFYSFFLNLVLFSGWNLATENLAIYNRSESIFYRDPSQRVVQFNMYNIHCFLVCTFCNGVGIWGSYYLSNSRFQYSIYLHDL